MDRTMLGPQTHRFDWQALDTPGKRTIEQRVERQLAALHGAFDPVPTPAEMDDVGQRGAGETPLMVDELTGKHGDKHDTDEVCGA
jgi:hypothetical protein